MGRLVIAHHKSYHPYRRDNIEKVRRDEEEARAKEAKEEGRMMLADSEARIDRLREQALVSRKVKGKEKESDFLGPTVVGNSTQPQTLMSSSGHVNLFEDLEQNAVTAAIRSSRKKDDIKEDDRGVRLAPSAKDLKPWYSEALQKHNVPEEPDDKQRRDIARKSAHDPLTSITHQLATRSSVSSTRRPGSRQSLPSTSSASDARLARESSERERALALIRKKKREMEGSETPSTVYEPEGYGDVYNKREVEEAHRRGRDHRHLHLRWRDEPKRERRNSWGR